MFQYTNFTGISKPSLFCSYWGNREAHRPEIHKCIPSQRLLYTASPAMCVQRTT